MTNYFNTDLEFNKVWSMQKEFLELIYHDKRSGKVAFAEKDEKNFSETVSERAQFINCTIDKDSYVSSNSFKNKRNNKNIYNLCNLIIDIDFHNDEDKDTVIQLLNNAYNQNKLPVPNVINFTGRGLCLVYSLKDSIPVLKKAHVNKDAKSTSEKTYEFYKAVYDGLFNVYDLVLDNHAHVDRNVSDVSRLIRLPGTFNTKVVTNDCMEAMCYTMYKHENYYNLYELNKYTVQKDKTFTKTTEDFLTKRMSMLQKLVSLREGHMKGIRNTFMIAYGSVCAQLNLDVLKECLEINGTFAEPLRDSEVKSVVKSLLRKTSDNITGYKITNKWLIERLGLSDADIKSLCIGERKRETLRAKRRKEKSDRDNLIIRMNDDGYTYEEIAKKAGCSIRTVNNILHKCARGKDKTINFVRVIRNNEECKNGTYKVVNKEAEADAEFTYQPLIERVIVTTFSHTFVHNLSYNTG